MSAARSGGGRWGGSARLGAGAGLLWALALGFGLSFTTLTEVGVVGEVAASWAQPPAVLISVDPRIRSHGGAPGDGAAGRRLGPLRWSPTRPTLTLGPLPLQVNAYTGGLPDWPTRAAVAAAGLPGARALHLLLGGGLVGVVWALGWRLGGARVAVLAALLLATRWDFWVWRAMLGGTELALIAASLALFFGLSGAAGAGRGRWLAAGLALGLHAKVTFLLSAAPLWLAAPRFGRRIGPRGRWAGLLGLGLGAGPALLAALLASLSDPAAPSVRSHDSLALQLGRVAGLLRGEAGSREQLGNLARWMLDPSPFLVRAWGADPALLPGPAAGAALGLGWALALIGLVAGWRRAGPAGAALRGLTVALPLQVLLLLIFARDLHHLGQLAGLAALWTALCYAGLADRLSGGRPARAAALGLVLAAPAALGGALSLRSVDPLLRSAPAPTLSASGQAALLSLLDESGAKRVVLCDYEASGALELLRPGLQLDNAWGAASHGRAGLVEELVAAAAGDHLLVLRASAPLIYNRAPSPGQLQAVAAGLGLRVEAVGALPNGRAALYRVAAP